MSYVKQESSGGGGGDTYTLRAAQSGSDVDIQLDATTGADSDVKLKAGTNITLTEASDTITIDSAGVAGSIGADQVAFGDPSNVGQIKGSDNFTFTDESGGSGPTTVLKGDKPILQMEDDTGATNFITELQQSGASMFVLARRTGGETDLKELMRLQRTEIAINDDNENLDVRIEGQSVDNLLRTDASTDTVGIGTAPDSGIERLHVKGSGLTDMVVFEGTTEGTGSTDGPDLVLYNSATPTGPNKFIGRLEFRGKDDAGAALPYSTIQTFIQDETAGSEDGLMLFKTQTNSAALEKMRLDKDGVILNQTGAALDFRVVGDTKSNLLKVDGGLDEIGIGSAPTSGQGILQVDGDVNFKGLIKVNNVSGTAGQVLTSQGPSADPVWAAGGGGGGNEFNVELTDDDVISGNQRFRVDRLCGWGAIGGGTSSFSNQDNPIFRPFIAPFTGTLNEIGVDCATADATGVTQYRIGFYDDLDGAPNDLMGTPATSILIPLTSTGQVYVSGGSVNNISFTRGRQYWYALVRNNTTNSINVRAASNGNLNWVGPSSSSSSSANQQPTFQLSSSESVLPTTVTQSNLSVTFQSPAMVTIKKS